MDVLRFFLPFMFLGLSACSTVSYLSQATLGQMELWNRARPIPEVIQDPSVSPRIKDLLSQVSEVKKFGESQGLKATRNYENYVQLHRSYVVMVVSASEPLRFQSKAWSFPIVGSFPYLGFFDEKKAQSYASSLEAEGMDVDVRGAAAYSTLGWFRDPVLSSMIPEGDRAVGGLVDTILHESLHATLYFEGQSHFNEGLASFVAEKLTPLYLDKKYGKDSQELKAYLASLEFSSHLTQNFFQAYQKLDALYSSQALEANKRQEKEKILADLNQHFPLGRKINNATLLQFKTYDGSFEAFEGFYKKCESDLRRFLSALSRIQESFRQPQQTDLTVLLKSVSC